ncbi:MULTISPECIES: SHOCT domain-containing protein [Streptomyces]|uniref:SHOCT domain-containing protein n=1 Tax=Streptomyces solicathayae TaxID=3081768 RepID=A0ABZ0M4Y7_9ACTN|nr:SHOCT domain-containing protein [Streptomyces sp. HUAS YS2]WOX26843.1 SHOCT domain-containing protein [Streptomyces sp. HUAS YS2]
MMFWYGDGMNGWGWFAMSAGMVLFWGLLITVAVMLFRTWGRAEERPSGPRSPTSAEQILGERLARGEIDEEEYRRRLSALRSAEP